MFSPQEAITKSKIEPKITSKKEIIECRNQLNVKPMK
jgi:hypothetical protein